MSPKLRHELDNMGEEPIWNFQFLISDGQYETFGRVYHIAHVCDQDAGDCEAAERVGPSGAVDDCSRFGPMARIHEPDGFADKRFAFGEVP
eukprot:NODE_725_length_2806_cov_3.215752.p9 GENE.NODE_725_length_2806_cov_3.215752~~NODE_725_length_2806_cov_3.215752.p9  ORF type:complete len:91 (+),score=18.49 NODE_725_length_2806_cov_3.215752:1649-1921(+)